MYQVGMMDANGAKSVSLDYNNTVGETHYIYDSPSYVPYCNVCTAIDYTYMSCTCWCVWQVLFEFFCVVCSIMCTQVSILCYIYVAFRL
jgi:hypothetical protein